MKYSCLNLSHLQRFLQFSIAFIWLYTGIISLVFASSQGFPLLQRSGITIQWQPVLLYGGAVFNLLLGVLVLSNWRTTIIGVIQILCILIYTIIASLLIPSYWMHPLAPLAKNIPIIAAIWATIVLNKVTNVL